MIFKNTIGNIPEGTPLNNQEEIDAFFQNNFAIHDDYLLNAHLAFMEAGKILSKRFIIENGNIVIYIRFNSEEDYNEYMQLEIIQQYEDLLVDFGLTTIFEIFDGYQETVILDLIFN